MDVMRLNSQCISCLLNKHLKDIPNNFSNSQKVQYMQEILKIIGGADISASAPEIVEQISCFKESIGISEDYADIKHHYNKYMLSYEKEIEMKICESANPLKTAVKFAMVGNFIDFGAMANVDEEKLKSLIYNVDEIKVAKNEFEKFEKEVFNAQNIVYITDNCGEIVLDKLLIKQILKLNKKVNIDVIVRGKPVLNDCTIDDAKEVGLDSIVNVTGNGTAIAGTVIDKILPECKENIDKADLIISKGQGNFETLRHCGKNIYYLFLCKCQMFADRFGVDIFTGMFTNDKRCK